MRVILKRNWFVGGSLYRKGANGGSTQVPDQFRDRLPPDAKVVDGSFVEPKAPPEPQLASDFDNERRVKEEEARLLKEAEAEEKRREELRRNAEEFQRQLEEDAKREKNDPPPGDKGSRDTKGKAGK